MKKKLKKLTAFMVSATMVFPIFGEYPSGTFKLGWDSSFSASAMEDLSPAEEITVTIDTGESVTLNDNDNDGYYDIGTADELYAFASIVNNSNTAINVELTTDITVNDNVLDENRELNSDNSDNFRVWTPIGNYSNKYKGTFEGNSKTISGLYFDNFEGSYVGLFGLIKGAEIRNIGIIDSYFKGLNYVGSICGYKWNSAIANCYNKSNISGNNSVGGICGYNDGSTITNCYNTGDVSGYKMIGGMYGYNYYGTITNCYTTGNIYGIFIAGSVCGYNIGGTIANCYYDKTFSNSVAVGYNTNGKVSDNVISKSTEQFASGEVAYLLQGDQTEAVWGQTLTGKNAQAYPVLNGEKIHLGFENCNSNEKKYINNEKPIHTFSEDSNGFCIGCNYGYEKPETDQNNIYQISNAGELYWFMENVNAGNTSANAVLTADIVVNESLEDSPRKWFPIGYGYDRNDDGSKEYIEYKGTFNGQNHTISGLYFDNENQDYVGLFGYTIKYAEIKNVGVINSFFRGKDKIGGICGDNRSTITNCYNTGSVNGDSDVGGVCGENSHHNSITNCYNTGDINGNNNVGGICGQNSGTITNCYNTGSVNGDSYVGGICGCNSSSKKQISNCYNIGSINGDFQVGGICGVNRSTITSCYNTGNVNGDSYVGGVCGSNRAGIRSCYNIGSVNGDSYVGGVCGNNKRTIKNCYYLSGTATGAINGSDTPDSADVKTMKEFASGEVAYLLNGDQATMNWYQTIGEDAYPVLDNTHETVYYGYLHCYDTDMQYTNDSNISDTISNHTYGYTATDNIINVSCVNNGCNEKGTIEIFANDRSCDGEAVTATVINTFNETDYNNQIVYKDSEGNIVDKAVIGGTYTANLTIEGVTASVEFVITHVGGNATCTEKAICEVCGEQYGEVDAKNHSGETEIKNAADATCTVEGYTGDTCCKDCGAVLESGKTIESNGHVGGNATCTEKATCEVCGERYGEVDAENHSGETEIKNAADATCTAEGYTGDTCCKDCGAVLDEGEIITAEGHEYICVVKDIPNANENIILTYICKKCDDTYTEEIVNIPDPAKGVTAEVTYATYSGNGGQIEITFTNGGEDIIGEWNIELDLNIDGKLTNTWGDGYVTSFENGHVTIVNQSWSQDFKAGAVKKVCFQYSGNLDGFITCMQNDATIIASVNNLNHWGNGGQIEIILENTGETLIDGWGSELTINLNGKLAATWGDGFVSSYENGEIVIENQNWVKGFENGTTKSVWLQYNGVLPIEISDIVVN